MPIPINPFVWHETENLPKRCATCHYWEEVGAEVESLSWSQPPHPKEWGLKDKTGKPG